MLLIRCFNELLVVLYWLFHKISLFSFNRWGWFRLWASSHIFCSITRITLVIKEGCDRYNMAYYAPKIQHCLPVHSYMSERNRWLKLVFSLSLANCSKSPMITCHIPVFFIIRELLRACWKGICSHCILVRQLAVMKYLKFNKFNSFEECLDYYCYLNSIGIVIILLLLYDIIIIIIIILLLLLLLLIILLLLLLW